MLDNRQKAISARRGERGATLFFALFAMMFLSGYILVNINVDRKRVLNERAAQTAWLVNEIAQAARLYVRDRSVTGGDPLFQKTALCTTPRDITVNDLVANGYIGPNIGQRNAAGTNFITPFNQTIVIRAANSRINTASCAIGNLMDIAATAYIVLNPPPPPEQIDGQVVIAVANALSNQGLTIIPPRFDAAGANVSNNCSGAPATLQWDTGCMTAAQYNVLMGGAAFAANTIGVPAWLSSRGDNRAVFRFEQAENPLAQTMQTDLRMAAMNNIDPASCNQVQITAATAGAPTDSVQVPSGVCATDPTTDDDRPGFDNRRDIVNLSNLRANRILLAPQAFDAGGTDAANDLLVNGNAIVNGSARSFATTHNPGDPANSIAMANVTMIDPDTADPNIGPGFTVAGRPGGAAPTLTFTNNMTTGTLRADNSGLVRGNATVASNTTANNRLQVNGSSNVTGGGRNAVLINRVSGTVNTMTISGEAVIGGTTQVGNTTTVNNSGSASGLAFATTRLDTRQAEMNGNVAVGRQITTRGTTTVTGIDNVRADSVTQCMGTCPDREDDPAVPLP